MKMLGRLPTSFSASATIRSSTGAKRAVQDPVAHSASALPLAIRSSVGSPLKMSAPGLARSQSKRKDRARRSYLEEGIPNQS